MSPQQSVSIIIPCFNAERWVSEAIQSCLDQTYPACEIVVIDDGSSDGSFNTIRSFGSKIRWERIPNGGANVARNHGIALSSGEYVQFLDADDYLLPSKVARQIHHLEVTGADIVYGDWQHQYHDDWRSSPTLGEVNISGVQPDVLEALLSGWWVANNALLFRRSIVSAIGGWDETLQAAQDRDLFISALTLGAKVEYQPGCYSIYRRYGAVTTSTSDRRRWLESHVQLLGKARKALREKGRLSKRYKVAMAHSYFALARDYFDLDRQKYASVMNEVVALDPEFRPKVSSVYDLTQALLGYSVAERLASLKRYCFPSRDGGRK